MEEKTPLGVIVYDEKYPDLADFIRHLPENFDKQGTVIYNKRNLIKVFDCNGKKICVKQYAVPSIGNRLLYSLGLRTPKARRHYEYAREILRRGFSTPVSYGYMIQYRNGVLGHSGLVCDLAQGMQSVGEGIKNNPELLRAFAAYTADLHQRGLMHRDYILNNVLYCKENGQYKFVLIDINRFVFRKKPLGLFLTCVNMMQPFHDETAVRTFVKEYVRFRPMPAYFETLVVLFRKVRTFYSHFKHILKKIPGAKRLRGKYTNQQK